MQPPDRRSSELATAAYLNELSSGLRPLPRVFPKPSCNLARRRGHLSPSVEGVTNAFYVLAPLLCSARCNCRDNPTCPGWAHTRDNDLYGVINEGFFYRQNVKILVYQSINRICGNPHNTFSINKVFCRLTRGRRDNFCNLFNNFPRSSRVGTYVRQRKGQA